MPIKRPSKGIPSRSDGIWADTIKICKNQLRSQKNNALLLEAARYFFELPQPGDGDEQNMSTFTGLMNSVGIDPNVAAESIFNQLTPNQQRCVCLALKTNGYNVDQKFFESVA